MLEHKLGIDIHTCLQDIITIHQPRGNNHMCSDHCKHFYPLQTCSNVCGIVVMCMVAMMAEDWEGWHEWNNTTAPKFLLNPTLYSNYLRINALSWVVMDKIDTGTLNKFPQSQYQSTSCVVEVDNTQATPKCGTYTHTNTAENQMSSIDHFAGC